LLIFTFVDPNKRQEIIMAEGSEITHRYICAHNTPAFFVVMLLYEGGMVLVGCVLAFKTRNLKDEFNESKQIILAMYDTAVIGSVVLIVVKTTESYQAGQSILLALATFWITCFASLVFVIPRLLQLRSRLTSESRHRRTQVTGLSLGYTGANTMNTQMTSENRTSNLSTASGENRTSNASAASCGSAAKDRLSGVETAKPVSSDSDEEATPSQVSFSASTKVSDEEAARVSISVAGSAEEVTDESNGDGTSARVSFSPSTKNVLGVVEEAAENGEVSEVKAEAANGGSDSPDDDEHGKFLAFLETKTTEENP
jgi:hypothetical protein